MSEIVLRHHTLHHIRELKIDPDVLRARFAPSCSLTRCTAQCCETGVWIDSREHASILQHAALIQAHMDQSQEQSPDRWFDAKVWEHADFPSGRAIGTTVANGACVFLGLDRRCVLQKASNAHVGNLKPFFCVAFPLMIEEGELCLDEARDDACCTQDQKGSLTVFELCANELEHVLGPDGVTELRHHADGSE